MCGIAGCVVASDHPVDRRALERMAQALGHRGPDDMGIEIVGNTGLVHTRLAIVDPGPAGHAPMGVEDSSWWLTYNGEVFNHLELREQLPGGTPWRGGSDTETVLRVLAADGLTAPARFNGLFALAALDAGGGRLLLMRDRFGVKPLYIARHEDTLWFASEQRALLAAGVPARVRVDRLTHAIGYGWVQGRDTLLQGVRRVLPGTTIEVDLRSLEETEHTWYDPADVIDPGAVAPADPQLVVGEALGISVRRRLMGDVPVATMCSGGIDSSLITILAARERPGLPAYHVALPEQPAYDERPFAEAVARRAGAELRVHPMTAAGWRADLVDVVVHHEYPLLHPSSVPMFQLARLATGDGVKVLLSGEGADELFGGYDYLHRPERAWLARRRPWPPHDRASRREELPTAYEREVRERAEAAYAHHAGALGAVEGAVLSELRTYLPHLLNRQDKTTMQASVETRVPFLDPDLVALALNLPWRLRADKRVLRELAAPLMPAAALQRPKAGFGFDTAAMITAAADPGFLDDGMLREVLGFERDAWREGVRAAAGSLPLATWTAEIWCRAFLAGDAPEAISAALWR